ncbi:hypothetical protein AJ80_04927 [Polytolypa hystricis UAMH7299]|uniref:Uncharacterized protein n=1 Tax=Polytolypa hystricis (strain UAMH7299) TaxID=1447883 RepID=A0A2B7Y8G3_POLH7|nr:hypothetical protein AJ80_04927 [Polytolypa hystricis UAMH7299]
MKVLSVLLLTIIAAAMAMPEPMPNPVPEELRQKPPKKCASLGGDCSRLECCPGYECGDWNRSIKCMPKKWP